MGLEQRGVEELLLDWHLDRLEEPEHSTMAQALQDDPELLAKSERLGRILQPLDHWGHASGPPNLADRIMSHVGESRSSSGTIFSMADDGRAPRRAPILSMREMIAVAACLALLVTVAIPGIAGMRDRSRRVVCANNLGSVFRGLSTYQASFSGSLPYAGSMINASWLPGGNSDRPYLSNSRHLYLLVKLDYGPSTADFICPGCGTSEAMSQEGCGEHGDFARSCNVSYDSLNLAGASPNLRPPTQLPYLSDANPLFIGAKFNSSLDPDHTNSLAHRGRGQTVLTLDGVAQWTTSPLFGKNRDNFWLAGNTRRYTGVESPSSRDDAQLVPGFPSTDPIVRRTMRELN